jgi:hypothetical protein
MTLSHAQIMNVNTTFLAPVAAMSAPLPRDAQALQLINVQRRYADKPGALPDLEEREQLQPGNWVLLVVRDYPVEKNVGVHITERRGDGSYTGITLASTYAVGRGTQITFGPEHILQLDTLVEELAS